MIFFKKFEKPEDEQIAPESELTQLRASIKKQLPENIAWIALKELDRRSVGSRIRHRTELCRISDFPALDSSHGRQSGYQTRRRNIHIPALRPVASQRPDS